MYFLLGYIYFIYFPFRGIFSLLFRLVSRTHHSGPSVSTWSLIARCCAGFKSSLPASPFFSPKSVCDLSSSDVRDSDSQALFFPGAKSLGIWSGIITKLLGWSPSCTCLSLYRFRAFGCPAESPRYLGLPSKRNLPLSG